MKRGFILFGLLTLVLAASIGSAQVVTKGTLQVILTDDQGARLPGGTVSASASDTVTAREAVTDSQGEAVLQALDPSPSYVITVTLPGFNDARHEAILVRSGHTATVRIAMSLAGVAETITVTSETPLVDTTSAIAGQDITLELTESLPTGRTYQSYLQLVPGVMPDDKEQQGNPASKSGTNYSDIRGEVGISRDNFYYIDGINVTDGTTGTFGANLNTEIILEQKVLTGGIPAEFVGSAGLLSNVVLKTGTNDLHGSVNYFFQNDSLVAKNKNSEDQKFSTFDTAFTLGGPIMTDRAWFFASYRRVERDDDVTTLDTAELIRTVNSTQNQWYLRGTWSPSANDTVSFTFLNDPLNASGRRDRNITNAQDRARNQGGERYNLNYSRLFGTNALLNVGWNKHQGEVTDLAAIREPENLVRFLATDDRTLEDEQLGGFGEDLPSSRDTEAFRVALDYSVNRHDLKTGFEYKRNKLFEDSLTLGSPPAEWTSLAPHLAGLTAGETVSGILGGNNVFTPGNASDYNGFIKTIDGLPNRDDFYDAFDADGDGTISQDELADNLVYDSTEGNPNGKVNYSRIEQVQTGEQNYSSRGYSIFGQDTFQYGQFVFNAGMRVELYRHYASDGSFIFEFPWMWAPRLSATYDIKGDGRQKISAYWGRYYDPIRNNMTNFAGQLSGSVREEQVFALGQWVNYRTRGGAQQPDALFAPSTKTPYTDDLQIGYQIDLGQSMSFETTYTNRRTRDILEDYDLSLYAYDVDGVSTIYPGDINHPDSLWLGLDYFGYAQNPGSNFVIATLAGGKRDYQGMEFVFRKRYTDRWQMLASYTFNDAEGNTNSDSNADFQGDVEWLDPRAPNQFGTQPGLIKHLLKIAGTYQFDMGLEVGAGLGWNSGVKLSRTFLHSRRHLPALLAELDQPAIEFAGITSDFWLAPDVVGTVDNPSWATLDLRVQYVINRGQRVNAQVFVDIFNVTNNQNSRRNQDLVPGEGGIAFGEPVQFIDPTRFYLGARLNF